jgi:hypothetical protein
MPKTLKPWAVMCCACFRFLAEDSLLTKWRRPKRKMPTSTQEWTRALKDAASFNSHEEADAAATKAGWQTADDLGPGNHRCPECLKDKPREDIPVRRGAYILITDMISAPPGKGRKRP